jgi:hypothetical protein
MNTHPDVGALRAWLDQEDESETAHVEDCVACRQLVAELRESAAFAAVSLGRLEPAGLPNPAEVRARLQRDFGEPRRGLSARIPGSWRVAASGLAAALVVGLLVAFTPAGQTAAAQFLAQFRSQQVAPVEVSAQSQTELQRALMGLSHIGTVKLPPRQSLEPGPDAKPVSLTEASRAVGFNLLTPDPTMLPNGFERTPNVHVVQPSEVRFTFDTNKARAYFDSIGHPEVRLPDEFNGATLVVSMPAAALLSYQSQANNHPALVIGEAGELTVNMEGKVTLDQLRDFLLNLPGLPAETVRQLRAINNWHETLPIPIPTSSVHWQSVSFNGAQGLLLDDNSGIGSAAIWQSGGHLYGLAGTFKATELKRIADSLH